MSGIDEPARENSREDVKGAMENEAGNGTVFTPQERATIEAVTARIIPADSDAGALEAGVIDYIEGILEPSEEVLSNGEKKEIANFLLGTMSGRGEERQRELFKLLGCESQHRELYLRGVKELDGLARERFGANGFCELDPAQQDQLLGVLEERQDPFFSVIVRHTMEGFYGHPRHGGNRAYGGWKMLGYQGSGFPNGYEKPFGWYDANVPDDFAAKKRNEP